MKAMSGTAPTFESLSIRIDCDQKPFFRRPNLSELPPLRRSVAGHRVGNETSARLGCNRMLLPHTGRRCKR